MTPHLHPDGRPTDSLRHLRPLADISLSPSVTTSTVPHNERTHRRLVRLGRVLLVLGPALIMSHILSDTQFAGETAVWTYTLASYDVASSSRSLEQHSPGEPHPPSRCAADDRAGTGHCDPLRPVIVVVVIWTGVG